MPCSVVLRFLALMTVAAAVLQSPARRRSLQSLRLGNVSCGCSKNMTQLVVKRTKVFDCTNVPYRGPRGLPSANEKGYPLRVRVRRSVDNSRMFINWNLKYIPKKKRAKVTDFYLHFTKPQKKSKTRTAQRGACFVVLPNGSKKCQRKVSCVANFSKRRPRRVSVNLLYRFAAKKSKNGGRRKRRGGQKYFRLKASARRKRSIKGYQGSSPRTRNPEISSCDEWSPSIKTECAGEGKLLVEFGPENPLAETIEVGLHEGISPRQMDTKYIQGNTSCTFENLQSGNYSVTLRPRSPNCYGVLPFRSEIIHVNGEHLSPLCSDWTPNAKIREIGVDHSRIEVSYDVPNNLQANQIEVALEEDNKRVAHKIVDRRERNCTFDIVPKKDKTYQAMVRPRGCKDCMDFTLHGDPCELSFHTSRAIQIGETRAVGLTVGKSRGSPFSNPYRPEFHLRADDVPANRDNTNRDNRQGDNINRDNINNPPTGTAWGVAYHSSGYASLQCADCCRRCACGSRDM